MAQSHHPAIARPLRILIVEDEALVAMEIEAMLELAGHQPVGIADDLPSAVAAATTTLPDLALVDIQLARGSSGLDVAAALHARGIPVLFASGNCPAVASPTIALGCLQKPISDRVLAAALQAVSVKLQGGVPNSALSGLQLY